MNCLEAELYVSSLHDGEPVPPLAASHIAGCQTCRSLLNHYAALAAELRLSAAAHPSRHPDIAAGPGPNPLSYLRSRVNVPRFILAALCLCLIAATSATVLLHAQSHPLWFQFAYSLSPHPAPVSEIAQNGYDRQLAVSQANEVAGRTIYFHIQIARVSDNDVALRIRATHHRGNVSLERAPVIHYKPGTSLAIPVEGGGTLQLEGSVLDVQPKIAFGYPLEPAAGQLTMRGPLFVSGDTVLADLPSLDASAGNADTGIEINAGPDGIFWFGVRPFPGAIQTQSEWGQIAFRLDGRNYRLLSPAPFLGGEQPRPVWVRRDPPNPHARSSFGVELLPRQESQHAGRR